MPEHSPPTVEEAYRKDLLRIEEKIDALLERLTAVEKNVEEIAPIAQVFQEFGAMMNGGTTPGGVPMLGQSVESQS